LFLKSRTNCDFLSIKKWFLTIFFPSFRRRLAVNFVSRIFFFPFNVKNSPVQVFLNFILSPIAFEGPGVISVRFHVAVVKTKNYDLFHIEGFFKFFVSLLRYFFVFWGFIQRFFADFLRFLGFFVGLFGFFCHYHSNSDVC
jgi:hypothetical protein